MVTWTLVYYPTSSLYMCFDYKHASSPELVLTSFSISNFGTSSTGFSLAFPWFMSFMC